jgi:4-hydroxy-tetrahydrodipicolinate reductase
VRIAVVGASGRMGRAVVRLAIEEGMTVAHAIGTTDVGADAGTLAGAETIGVRVGSDLGAIANVDAIVDFSSPAVTAAVAAAAQRAKAALVSGTTGVDEKGQSALASCAQEVPTLWEPNMSVGIHVLGRLLERAVALLPSADIEIVETHHRAKVDAPSGTALRLAGIAQRARDGSRIVSGREGKPGPRSSAEIGVFAVRGGDVIGDHSVHLLMAGERIELTHRASSRDLFARGALRAAKWLQGKPAGAYRLADVIG